MDARGQRRVRRHLRLHEAVREAGPQGQGGRRAGHRGDRILLHRAARRRLRERWRPAQVRRRRAVAVLLGRGTRCSGRRVRRGDAHHPADRRQDQPAARQDPAAHVGGRAQRFVRLLPRGGFSPRADRGRPGLDAHGADGARSDRGPDPREPGYGGAAARRMPRPGRRPGLVAHPGTLRGGTGRGRGPSGSGGRHDRRMSVGRVACPRGRGRRRPRAPAGGHGVPPVRRDR